MTFQTGTTAGTITLTLTFPNGAPVTKSFTISPQQVQITAATALRQSPNLVVTLTGFDNTYSTGKLSFTFFDTSGKQITPNAINVDASGAFSTYFFTNNQAGGAFSVQATFPVTGDVTQIGSVNVGMSNSARREQHQSDFSIRTARCEPPLRLSGTRRRTRTPHAGSPFMANAPLFRRQIVNQNVDLGIAQFRPESGHQCAAEFDSGHYVRTAWLTMAERKLFVLEQMIQTRADFSALFLDPCRYRGKPRSSRGTDRVPRLEVIFPRAAV